MRSLRPRAVAAAVVFVSSFNRHQRARTASPGCIYPDLVEQTQLQRRSALQNAQHAFEPLPSLVARKTSAKSCLTFALVSVLLYLVSVMQPNLILTSLLVQSSVACSYSAELGRSVDCTRLRRLIRPTHAVPRKTCLNHSPTRADRRYCATRSGTLQPNCL